MWKRATWICSNCTRLTPLRKISAVRPAAYLSTLKKRFASQTELENTVHEVTPLAELLPNGKSSNVKSAGRRRLRNKGSSKKSSESEPLSSETSPRLLEKDELSEARKLARKATPKKPALIKRTGSKSILARKRQLAAEKRECIKSDATENVDTSSAPPDPIEMIINGAEVNVVDVEPLHDIPVPNLAHGLDRVLFNPGVYYLQDPRSHVYNFDPYLQNITPVKDFNYDALHEYITSSRDETLDELARSNNLKFVGSTSSMTSVLSQFHYFISNFRPIDTGRLSSAFAKSPRTFTISSRAPSSIYLRYNDGVYAIDSDKSLDTGDTILSFLGRSMEKMLTLTPGEFSKYRKENADQIDPSETKKREAYHYSKLGTLLMRSQLDCRDSRLPGTGTFDLKTRAVLPVRMDVRNAHEGAGYQIQKSTGLVESFEREYYDMIRSAFLKYSLQVRIGKMDGIFAAFHNTERVFGFQYISIDEMDECIHGSSTIAQREFIMSLRQLDEILQLAVQKYPNTSLLLTFEALEAKSPQMNVIVEVMTEEEINERQEGKFAEALQAASLASNSGSLESQDKTVAYDQAAGDNEHLLESMSSTLEKILSRKGSLMMEMLRKTEKPLESSKKVDHTTSVSAGAEEKEVVGEEKTKQRILYKITGRNYVQDKLIEGPPVPKQNQKWEMQYSIQQYNNDKIIDDQVRIMEEKRIFAFADLLSEDEEAEKKATDPFMRSMSDLSKKGRKYLAKSHQDRKGLPVIIYKQK